MPEVRNNRNKKSVWLHLCAFIILTFLLVIPSPAQTGGEESRSALNVFPNPTTGKFTVEVKEQERPYDVNVYNLVGEMVLHWESKGTSAVKFEIDLSARPDGIYFVELDTEKANSVRRIILERHN